jgi:signal transduction histidine kinase
MFASRLTPFPKNSCISDAIQLCILNTVDDIILLFCVENGSLTIQYYNQAANHYFAWENCNPIGKTFLDLTKNETLRSYLVECMKEFIPNSEKPFEQYPLCQRDDKIIIWTFKQINLNSKNHPSYYLLLVGDDITEEERLRSERQQAQDYLDNIKNCMPGNVYWKDSDGRYIGCNDYLLNQHNLTNPGENIIGKTDYDIFSKEVADKLRTNDKEVMQSGQPISFEENIQLSNQSVRTYLVNKAPLKNSFGKIIGVVGNSIEITELKETQTALVKAKEEAEESNFTKSVFMENMSHDFKTPLNAIFGVLQILEMTPELPDDVKKLIQVQEKSVHRLKKMVESILDYSKISSGKIEIQHEEVNLLEIIENIVHNLSYLVKDKDINIIINYPLEVPRNLLSDSNSVTSILLNLMSNAVKFTESGYIAISVKILSVENKNTIFEINVEDTGAGIPDDKLHQIFERFHRLELSNLGQKAGHGIGLAVVKELIEKLNGHIHVHSQLGKGSIFTVDLPFEVEDTTLFSPEWQKCNPNVRILIVNDKNTATNIIPEQLGNMSIYKIDSERVIDELLLSEKNDPYQILIIDDEIQTSDPNALIKKINNQKELSLKMALLSTHPKNKEHYDAARNAGYFGFIIKPIFPSELDQKIIESWSKWQRKIKNLLR